MTTPSTWIPIFFLTLFSLQFLPSFPFHSNSTLLDHTTIVKQTMNFISSNFNSTSTTPFLSFPIYHIEYFIQSQFKNHSSLLQARLARDQARHKYLTSLFNPVNLNASTVSEVASGTDFFLRKGGSTEYLVELKVGSQRQTVNFHLDTGSDLIWLQCQPCKNCYNQKDFMFDPRRSSSFRKIDCGSSKCYRPCENRGSRDCPFKQKYGDGDQVSGSLAIDKFSLMDGQFEDDIIFGCAYDHIGHFSGEYGGILGFNDGNFSFTSQMKIKKFSFCLPADAKTNGTLFLGSAPPASDYDYEGEGTLKIGMFPKYQLPPLQQEHLFVEFKGISIANVMIPVDSKEWAVDSAGNGRVIIDSGTSITRFTSDIYKTFRDKFREEVDTNDDLTMVDSPVESLDTCYKLPPGQTLDTFSNAFPIVSFHFGNSKTHSQPILHLRGHQLFEYYQRKNNRWVVCLMFSDTSLDFNIIGTFQLKSAALYYDLSAGILSLTPDMCKEDM